MQRSISSLLFRSEKSRQKMQMKPYKSRNIPENLQILIFFHKSVRQVQKKTKQWLPDHSKTFTKLPRPQSDQSFSNSMLLLENWKESLLLGARYYCRFLFCSSLVFSINSHQWPQLHTLWKTAKKTLRKMKV